MQRTRTTNKQDAENGFLHRSCFAQSFSVLRVRPQSLATALQGNRFEHPAACTAHVSKSIRRVSRLIQRRGHQAISYRSSQGSEGGTRGFDCVFNIAG
jgi:hypothetical protein